MDGDYALKTICFFPLIFDLIQMALLTFHSTFYIGYVDENGMRNFFNPYQSDGEDSNHVSTKTH